MIPKRSAYVELGSGPHGKPGYWHIDVVGGGNVDEVADVRELSYIASDSIERLYAAHVLEHFSYADVGEVLAEWCRVVKPGGILTIKMPDLDFICNAYVKGVHSAEEVMVAIFGGFSDIPGGADGWAKISGNPNWERYTIADGDIPNPGVYTEWGAHKSLYTYDMIAPRLKRVGFTNIQRIVENDWELHITGSKQC